jgi:hypothetical protein
MLSLADAVVFAGVFAVDCGSGSGLPLSLI